MMSIRALGALAAMIRDPALTSAEKLSEAFLEGEKAIRRSLQELESAGFIRRGKYRVSGRIMAFTEVTDAGREFYFSNLPSAVYDRAVIGGDIQLNQQYNNYNSNSYTDIDCKRFSDGVRGEKKTIGIQVAPYDFFGKTSSDDDAVADRLKHQQERKAEYAAAKAAVAAKTLTRNNLPKSAWSCKDVAQEFADKVEEMWSIKPWSLTKSRFIPALASMRKRLDTDGEVECLMLDLFFESVAHDKYDSADALWKLFVIRGPELLQRARGMLSNEQDLVDAKQQADKSWDWMED